MSDNGEVGAGAAADATEMQTLREKLSLLQQFQALQGQVGLAPPQQPQRQQQQHFVTLINMNA